MYKFTTESRELWEFQPRCTQYESDPKSALSFLPMISLRVEGGRALVAINGTRFTTIRFEANVDVRTNQLNLSDEVLNKILADTFGIVFKRPIEFNSIMCEVKNQINKVPSTSV